MQPRDERQDERRTDTTPNERSTTEHRLGGEPVTMSTVAGYVEYVDRSSLNAAVERLQAVGFLDETPRWRYAPPTSDGERPYAADGQTDRVVVPRHVAPGIARHITAVFAGAMNGEIAGSSLDGTFLAWIEAPLSRAVLAGPDGPAPWPSGDPITEVRSVDLAALAVDAGLGVYDRRRTTAAAYAGWQARVCRAFHHRHDPDVPRGTQLGPLDDIGGGR